MPEISGVAFIFNQKFFKELYEVTGIDLENIVYYKDDTHYFVMTAKKHSLLDKGVLLNVSDARNALQKYLYLYEHQIRNDSTSTASVEIALSVEIFWRTVERFRCFSSR